MKKKREEKEVWVPGREFIDGGQSRASICIFENCRSLHVTLCGAATTKPHF
jgi:hypothetical protein